MVLKYRVSILVEEKLLIEYLLVRTLHLEDAHWMEVLISTRSFSSQSMHQEMELLKKFPPSKGLEEWPKSQQGLIEEIANSQEVG